MEDKLQILTTSVGVLVFLILFATQRWAAARKEIELITEHNAVRHRLIEQQSYQEGQLKTIERLVSLQEQRLERWSEWDAYLTDLLLLKLEGEDINQHIRLVIEAKEKDQD